MRKPRAGRKLLLLAVTALALGIVPLGAASASCGPPLLGADKPDQSERTPITGPLNASFTVSGTWFHSGCDDTGQGSGCGAPPSEEAPMRDVELTLEQGTRTAVVATADAASKSKKYRITWTVQIPSSFTAGPALLRAGVATYPIDLQ